MIITIFRPDGSMERRPVGYLGGDCHKATAPYEARELGVAKTPTADADRDPVQKVAEPQTQAVGG